MNTQNPYDNKMDGQEASFQQHQAGTNDSPSSSEENTNEQTRQSSKTPWIIAVVVVLLLLLAGGAYAGFYQYTGGGQSPQEVVWAAFENLNEQEQLAYSGSLEARIEPATSGSGQATSTEANVGGQSGELSMTFEGASSGSTLEGAQGKFSTEIDATNRGRTFAVGADARVLNESLYVRVNKAPAMLAAFLGDITGQWFRFDLQQAIEEQTGATSSNPYRLTEAQKGELESIFESHSEAFEITEGASESIEGVETQQFSVEVSEEPFKKLLLDLQKFSVEQTLNELDNEQAQQRIQTQQEQFRQELERMENFPQISADVWIGTDEQLPRRITVDVSGVTDQNPRGEYDATFRVDLSNFGEPVEVEAPEDSTSIQAFMQERFQGASSFGTQSGNQGAPVPGSGFEGVQSGVPSAPASANESQ